MRPELALSLAVLAAALAGCRESARPAPGPHIRLACQAPLPPAEHAPSSQGMVRIKGGRFSMGASPVRSEEGPAQTVKVGDFWIDRTEVTVADFTRFVAATGYRTLAERPLDPAMYPGLTAEQRRPSSLVFVGAGSRSTDPGLWWRVIPGADWRHPEGPGSSVKGREAFPVTHIAWEDAMAYARWLGRDLPTEAEWEYAARGGLDGRKYVWGDAPQDPAHPRANTWQGVFPIVDAGTDGYKATPAPAGCYPANGYGLYDMAGNVWEWTRDWYRPGLDGGDVAGLGGPPEVRALDPSEPGTPKHVIKGGSYLCSDDYCFRYRPAARTPGPPDTGASHIGFRTVLRISPA